MRIALVSEPAGGGTARYLLDIAEGLCSRNHQVTVFYSPVRSEEWFERRLASLSAVQSVSVAMKRSIGLSDFGGLWSLISVLRKHGPYDIIHSNSSKAGALCRIASIFSTGKQVYNPHAFRTLDPNLNSVGRGIYSTLEYALSALLTDALIVGSQQELLEARRIGISDTRTHRIVNGIQEVTLPDRDDVRKHLGLPADRFIMGFVGRLSEQKAPERALRALRLVDDPSICLAIIGSGELENKLRRLSHDECLNDRIYFFGSQNGQHAMAGMDALIVPSRYESMGYIFLESCLAALPCIATDVGIASDVISDNVNGFIVDNTDQPGPWASAISTLAQPEVLKRMKACCLDRRLPYTFDGMIDRTCELYQSLLVK